MAMMFDRPVKVLCDRHVIPILLHIQENGACTRTDIYGTIGHSANIPSKIDILIDAGLVDIEEAGRIGILSLTDLGSLVAERLLEIDDAMSSAQKP